MATSNLTITTEWSKIAEDSDDPVLIQAAYGFEYEVATVATDTAPVVIGHKILRGTYNAITRSMLGPGFIYARVTDDNITSTTLVVSK